MYGSLLPLYWVSYDACTYRPLQSQAGGDTGCRQTRRHDRRNGQGLYLGLFCLYISSLIATELQEAVKTFYIGLFCLYIRSRLSIQVSFASILGRMSRKRSTKPARHSFFFLKNSQGALLLARSLAVFQLR
jgi:hypothetical protein